jgi:hypothetical protein
MKNKKNKIRRCYFQVKEQDSEIAVSMIPIKVFAEAGKIWISPQGYGEKCAEDGKGYPIGLEIWQGKLRIVVFNDINSEDPQIINLENARESNRVEE